MASSSRLAWCPCRQHQGSKSPGTTPGLKLVQFQSQVLLLGKVALGDLGRCRQKSRQPHNPFISENALSSNAAIIVTGIACNSSGSTAANLVTMELLAVEVRSVLFVLTCSSNACRTFALHRLHMPHSHTHTYSFAPCCTLPWSDYGESFRTKWAAERTWESDGRSRAPSSYKLLLQP